MHRIFESNVSKTGISRKTVMKIALVQLEKRWKHIYQSAEKEYMKTGDLQRVRNVRQYYKEDRAIIEEAIRWVNSIPEDFLDMSPESISTLRFKGE